jgi:hypothetical protein
MNAQSKIEPATLASAMALAFAEIEAATKAANNPHFKTKYADLGAVIDAVKPALIKHGLFFTQHPEPSEEGVTVETMIHHSGGQSMSLGKLYVPANKKDAQGFGSALTYARRYALMTAFGVPAEDDDGNAAAKSSAANDRAGNGYADKAKADRDAPFPPGPAKNKTELKALGRDLWRDVNACEDAGQLDALVASSSALVKQLRDALPDWWNGGNRDGEPYEGLGSVIASRQTAFAAAQQAADYVKAG